MRRDMISLVVPCYNEEESLRLFYEEVVRVAAEMPEQDYEFLFIDDGSKDRTLKILKYLHEQDKRVRYISFSRNFGKEAGLYAGLEHAKGDYVAVLDADLQDPPELLKEMYQYLQSDEYDCVATRRVTRKGEPRIRTVFAKQFYKLINKISNADIVDGARDFRLMNRKMVDAILSMTEYNRFSKGIFGWVGFRTKWLSYDNVERVAGETKWSFWGLFVYAIDGIIAFSTTPLVIASVMGILFCLIALIMIVFFIVKTLAFGDLVPGYPSLVCILFFCFGNSVVLCRGYRAISVKSIYGDEKPAGIYHWQYRGGAGELIGNIQ